ncbi:hypothetical protein M409DRAFT_30788 [Zasmidium cellare ATCC 36951]|uniref:Uncharacterized protein n=1 Tax=Zasmidium cellare ATCC 36951 TaxID=1080233 RepID=A0A6A6BZ54_ZASCE|nr:uncharacterized protein M409DRAFT_30788 [Zasmidium cellare ATCC 36951]KAF2158696.1 hypothetical protein M409DRAFT_30788 [Zasmidium cellare ATCC 36951]
MEDTCLKFAPEVREPDSLIWTYWLNPDCTLFVLDEDFVDVFALTPCLGTATFLKIKKVALLWRHEDVLISTRARLQEHCPALDSIFTQRIRGGRRRRPADTNLKSMMSCSFKIMTADDAVVLEPLPRQPNLIERCIITMFPDKPVRVHFIRSEWAVVAEVLNDPASDAIRLFKIDFALWGVDHTDGKRINL